jgi:hypothetical protein
MIFFVSAYGIKWKFNRSTYIEGAGKTYIIYQIKLQVKRQMCGSHAGYNFNLWCSRSHQQSCMQQYNKYDIYNKECETA